MNLFFWTPAEFLLIPTYHNFDTTNSDIADFRLLWSTFPSQPYNEPQI